MRLLTLLCAIIFGAQALLSHPADTNSDFTITAQELVTYAAASPDANLLQQAENIWKHGGAYTASAATGSTVFVPLVDAISYTPISDYAMEPYTSTAIELPAQLDDLVAHYYLTENESALYPAALSEEEGEDGSEFYLSLPAHPTMPTEGGTVYLELTEHLNTPEETVYPIGFVSIAPLPPGNPGSFNSLLSAANAAISHLEDIRGIDYSDYFVGGPNYNGPFQDDAERIEIAAVRGLQDPGLRGSVVETINRLSAESADPAALMAQLDAAFNYEPIITVAELLPTQLTATTDGPAAAAAAGSRSAAALEGSSPRASGGSGRTFAPAPEITNGAQLAYFMREQYVAEEMLKDQIFSRTAGEMNAVLGLGGVINQTASASIGLTTVVLQLGYERKAGTYPSRAELIPFFPYGEFFQDDCGEVGQWECEAVATSKGWQADKVLLDLALNLIRSLSSAKLSNKKVKLLTDAAKSGGEFTVDSTIKELGTLTDIATIDPETWNIASIENPYVEMVQLGSVATIDETFYFPEEFGTSTVFIAARGTGAAAFPLGRVEASATELVTLNRTELTISGAPSNTYIAGQVYTMTAAAVNVRETTPSINWQASGGTLGTPITLADGRSRVDWTAPDPASTDIVTITADLNLALCYPLDAEAVSTEILTSGGRYRIQATPLKGCYDLGEDIFITFEDLDNPGAQPVTDFALTGPGTFFRTGPNTGTVSSEDPGRVGVIASLESNPSRFDSAEFIYGCADFELIITDLPNDIDILVATIGGVTLGLYGTISSDVNTLSVNFSAQTHYNLFQLPEYQEQFAEWQANGSQGDPPVEPVLGDVGTNNETMTVFNDPNFEIRIEVPYFTDNCNQPVTPPIVVLCYNEVDAAQNTIVTEGIAGEYAVDPALAATSSQIDIPGFDTRIDYTIFLTPDN